MIFFCKIYMQQHFYPPLTAVPLTTSHSRRTPPCFIHSVQALHRFKDTLSSRSLRSWNCKSGADESNKTKPRPVSTQGTLKRTNINISLAQGLVSLQRLKYMSYSQIKSLEICLSQLICGVSRLRSLSHC